METVAAMRAALAGRLKEAADDGRLVDLPDLFFNLRQWERWGTPEDVKAWFGRTVADDAILLRVLRHALRIGSVQDLRDRVARRIVSMDPRDLERYLPPTMSLQDLTARVEHVAAHAPLTDDDVTCIRAFRQGIEQARLEENPEAGGE